MVMTQNTTNYLSEIEFEDLQKVAIMISAVHARSFLQSENIEMAPGHDFYLIKELEKWSDLDIPGAQAYCSSVKNHAFYLRPEFVIMSLFSDESSFSDKEEIAQKLLVFEKPKEFKSFSYSEKDLKVTTEDIQTKHLKDLVSNNSWFLFQVFGEFGHDWLNKSPLTWKANENYVQMQKKIKNIVCINDACERGIKIAKDYINISRIENRFQDAILCYKNHRELHPFNNTGHWSKEDLNNLLSDVKITL